MRSEKKMVAFYVTAINLSSYFGKPLEDFE